VCWHALQGMLRTPILQAPRLHLDDTTLPMLERGRATTKQAHRWCYLGADQRLENGLWGRIARLYAIEAGDQGQATGSQTSRAAARPVH